MNIGDIAPDFELPEALGGTASLPENSAATVVIFTANHCPYARAWHDRLVAAAEDYADRDVPFIAISPNDPEQFPDDSLEAMRVRVEAEGGWPFPYVIDEDGTVARSYGATKTPHIFLLGPDRRLEYVGAPDANHDDQSQNASYVRQAIDAVLVGAAPSPVSTDPVGCSIKWKNT